MARDQDKFALVRSGSHNNDHHETATNWVLSGQFGSAVRRLPGDRRGRRPRDGLRGPLPPYVAVPRNPSFTWELGKSAFLGGRYESFKAGDPNDAELPRAGLSPPTDRRQVDRRQTLRQAVDGLAKQVEGNDQIAHATTSSSGARWTSSSRPRPAAPSTSTAKTPGSATATAAPRPASRCLLARRLVEAGVRFVTVNSGGWDHHAKIFDVARQDACPSSTAASRP